MVSFALMIIIIGYLQYGSQPENIHTNENKNDEKIGEAVFVDGEVQETDFETWNDVSDTVSAGEYFAEARLQKEISVSKDTETLKGITEDENAEEDLKTIAYQKMIKLVENSQKEMKIETLLKQKGYDDVIAVFGDDESLDIVIKAEKLSPIDIAQISDIAKRHANIMLEKVHIRNVY